MEENDKKYLGYRLKLSYRERQPRWWYVLPESVRFQLGLHVSEERADVLLLCYPCSFRGLFVV